VRLRERENSSLGSSTAREALEDITALFYDEEKNKIYTGDQLGKLRVWVKLKILGRYVCVYVNTSQV
jgi:hypothetical protein